MFIIGLQARRRDQSKTLKKKSIDGKASEYTSQLFPRILISYFGEKDQHLDFCQFIIGTAAFKQNA